MMTAKEIMTKDVATCTPHDDILHAMTLMRDHRCGFLPVVDDQGIVVGVVTDRDLCIALLRRDRAPERVPVTDAMSHPAFGCFPDENLKVLLGRMGNHHVRRMVVFDRVGRLEGVVSMDDIARVPRHHGTPSAEEIADALKIIAMGPSLITAG
jgi:CBS domain-containing protein